MGMTSTEGGSFFLTVISRLIASIHPDMSYNPKFSNFHASFELGTENKEAESEYSLPSRHLIPGRTILDPTWMVNFTW